MQIRRRPHARWIGFVAVAVGTMAIIGLVVAAGASVATATDRVGDLSYFLTGTANAHREVQKMEVASRGTTAADMAEIIRRREFAGQQLRLTVPGLVERKDPNPEAPRMLEDVRRLDAVIAANGNNAPTPELQQSIATVEVDLKRIYDTEEFRFFALNKAALQAKDQSEQLLLLLAGAIAASGVALLFVLRHTARNNLRQKADELAMALSALEAIQAERGELLDEMVRASERERTRLAAELHDGPIQALAALCFRLDRADSKLQRGDPAAAGPLVESARAELGDEVAELRRIMSELRPPALDEGGLSGATRDYVETFARQTGIETTTRIELDDNTRSPEREVVVYRLVQEALTNVRKHANADKVGVTVRGDNDDVELVVVDNGVGFDMAEMADHVKRSHYGLAGMRERVEAAGGKFSVLSAPGGGVQLHAWIPGQNALIGEAGDQSAA